MSPPVSLSGQAWLPPPGFLCWHHHRCVSTNTLGPKLSLVPSCFSCTQLTLGTGCLLCTQSPARAETWSCPQKPPVFCSRCPSPALATSHKALTCHSMEPTLPTTSAPNAGVCWGRPSLFQPSPEEPTGICFCFQVFLNNGRMNIFENKDVPLN